MEVAIRWSPHATPSQRKFLVIDVGGNSLTLRRITDIEGGIVKHERVSQLKKLPNFTAFDWSRREEPLVAIGSASGGALVLNVESSSEESGILKSFSIRHQRRCNSIAFNRENVLATGLDRVRNDFCLNIYDVEKSGAAVSDEPYRKLSTSESITSIKFLNSQPKVLLAGVARQCIRLYDLRDPSTTVAGQLATRQVHNLALDPLDDNAFISAGPAGDPTVSIWDIRKISPTVPTTPGAASAGALLELRPAVDNVASCSVWTLRYSGIKKGTFGVFASSGELKTFEMAQTSSLPAEPPVNPMGGQSWQAGLFAKRVTVLQEPSHSRIPQQIQPRAIAIDFAHISDNKSHHVILGLTEKREITLLQPARIPLGARATANDALFAELNNTCVVSQLSDRKFGPQRGSDHLPKEGKPSTKPDSQATSQSRKYNVGLPSDTTSIQYLPAINLREFQSDLAPFSIQRQRCFDGYLFDCNKNRGIVAEDEKLAKMWEVIGHLQHLAQDDGMVTDTLDLSLYGVNNIWSQQLGAFANRIVQQDLRIQPSIADATKLISDRNSIPQWQGPVTKYPDQRRLCLQICNWPLSRPEVDALCDQILISKQYYRAIAIPFFLGYQDISLRILKKCLQSGDMDNIGLAAILAQDPQKQSEPANEMCAWMADLAQDPYLKSILHAYQSSLKDVASLAIDLPLADRIAISLLYLKDHELTSFIHNTTKTAVRDGNIDGIVLTGLGDDAITLYQNYIERTNDIQTAVLAMAFSAPLYVSNRRFKLWRETYYDKMQSWKAFLQRTQFTVQHNRLAMLKRKVTTPLAQNLPARKVATALTTAVKVPRGQMTIRCPYCTYGIAQETQETAAAVEEDDDDDYDSPDSEATGIAHSTPAGIEPTPLSNGSLMESAGTPMPGRARHGRRKLKPPYHCKRCGATLPRCSICLLRTGGPDADEPGGRESLQSMDPYELLVQHCLRCGHGAHVYHASTWFSKHKECPVASCSCWCEYGLDMRTRSQIVATS